MKKQMLVLCAFLTIATMQGMDLEGGGAHSFDEHDVLAKQTEEQMYAAAIQEKLGIPLENGEQLLHFIKQSKGEQAYNTFTGQFAVRGKRKKSEMAQLYRALITAQAEHTAELKRQIDLEESLAARRSVSTQKALCVSRLRLCVALTAVGFTAISFTMNILQSLNVL